MSKILGSLVLVAALSMVGLPSAMAAGQAPVTTEKDGDQDKDKDQKHRRHHRHHHKHHHHRHHKHTPPPSKPDGTNSGAPSNT